MLNGLTSTYHQHLSSFSLERPIHHLLNSNLIQRVQAVAQDVFAKMEQSLTSVTRSTIDLKTIGIIGCLSLAILLILVLIPKWQKNSSFCLHRTGIIHRHSSSARNSSDFS